MPGACGQAATRAARIGHGVPMAATTRSPDWGALRRNADQQHALVTRTQCRTAGLTDALVQWRLATGRWTAQGRGVYLTTPGRGGWAVTAMTAFLQLESAVPRATVAFRGGSAARLWGLTDHDPTVVSLAVPHGRRVDAPTGVEVRQVRRWDAFVHDTEYPWRTTVPVTLLDLAHETGIDGAVGLLAEAVRTERVSAGELLAELRRRPRHRHLVLLTEALADVADGAQSAAEVRFIRDVERAHGLPVGTRQLATDSGRRRYHDNGYAEAKVIVEVDGRVGHEGWRNRTRDGQRDREVGGDGWFTVRVFWPDCAITPCRTAMECDALFRSRGWTGRATPCRRRDCVVPRATPP